MNFYEYLEEHGISDESVKKFDLYADSNRLVIPIKDEIGELLYNKYRNLEYSKDDPNASKYTFDRGSHPTLFNTTSLNGAAVVVLCEGEIDAIKLDEKFASQAIACLSPTGGASMFNEEMAKILADKKVFICYDNDEAGKKGAIKVATQFLPSARIITLPEDCNDICEFFQKHHEAQTEFITLMKSAKMCPLIPIFTLTDMLNTEYPTQDWLIDKFLAEQSICLLVGEAGTFKSFLCLYIIRQLITQEPFLGHFQVFRKCKILVIDKENKARRVKKRVEGLKLPHNDHVYFLQYPEEFSFDNEAFLLQVSSFIAQHKIDVVILDSFIDMFAGNENSSTDTAQAFNAIRSLSNDATFIAIHHDSKPIPKVIRSAAQKTRGSSNIIAQVDTQFYLEKGSDGKSIIVEQGKSRDDEPIGKFVIDVIMEDEQIADFRYRGDFKSEVVLIEQATDWILEFVTNNPMVSKEDIADTAANTQEFGARTLQYAIASLKEKKLIDAIRKPGMGNKMFYFTVE
jgi:uncharacterized protein YbaR (Trm112 family)